MLRGETLENSLCCFAAHGGQVETWDFIREKSGRRQFFYCGYMAAINGHLEMLKHMEGFNVPISSETLKIAATHGIYYYSDIGWCCDA